MRICFVSSEFMGWGVAGGFGFATRSLGRGLAARGVEVVAAIPQPRGRRERQLKIDGIQVLGYPRYSVRDMLQVFRSCDADIYHSQQESLASYLALREMPDRHHLVTCRDPRDWRDWLIEFKYPTFTKRKLLLALAFYENPLTRLAVRRADRVFVPAKFLREKVRRKHHLKQLPEFLPTPIRIPDTVAKADQPTVCYVGRLDRRKRPERFFELSRLFPDVRFIVAGVSQDTLFQESLTRQYGHLENLEQRGFVNQFEGRELSGILSASWVLINPAAREGLPNVFIEAAAHRCSLISSLDPDGFVSRFGELAADEDYAGALERLLASGAWRIKGEAGHRYVSQTNEAGKAVSLHLEVYTSLLAGDR